jgi:uncharacterized protein YggT (Ycf19 family)
MDFLKTVTGKVVGGIVTLIVVTTGISWWQMDDSTKHMLLGNTGRIVSWLGIVALTPWVTFFIINWVHTLQSNLAGGILVVVYSALEAVLLGWLFHWSLPGPTAWTFFAVGTLVAAVYNLLTCDWIAEKME